MMQVAPSVLAADFCRLGQEIEMINESEASMIHYDVMDGVFVPNISFGFPVLESIAKVAKKPLDCHLMIVDPIRYVSQVRDCGASIMNVHQEACTHLDRTIHAIREAGMRPAVTLNPATPVRMLEDVIQDLDMVLLMSVNPGYGGQKFIQNTIKKVTQLRELIKESGSKALIEIDGGVNMETGRQLSEAGAHILVAGSTVFRSKDPKATIHELSSL